MMGVTELDICACARVGLGRTVSVLRWVFVCFARWWILMSRVFSVVLECVANLGLLSLCTLCAAIDVWQSNFMVRHYV